MPSCSTSLAGDFASTVLDLSSEAKPIGVTSRRQGRVSRTVRAETAVTAACLQVCGYEPLLDALSYLQICRDGTACARQASELTELL